MNSEYNQDNNGNIFSCFTAQASQRQENKTKLMTLTNNIHIIILISELTRTISAVNDNIVNCYVVVSQCATSSFEM